MGVDSDATLPNMDDERLLEDVVLMKNPELTRAILEQTDFRCSSETMAVRRALDAGDVENVRVLLHHGRGWKTRRAIFEREIFQLISADSTSAKLIVSQLPDWNVIDEHFAISLRYLFERGTRDVVKMLLDCRVDLHVRDKFGIKLLINLFGNPTVNVIELLENRDFDVREQDVTGETALHAAVDNDVVNNVEFLLDRGADPNSKDCVGWTPLFAVKSVECMELLLRHDADLQRVDKDGHTIFDSLRASSDAMAKAALASLAVAEARGTAVRRVIRDKIDSDDTFRSFYEACHQEIARMKEQTAFGSDDLFAVLSDDTEKVSHRRLISSLLNETRATNGYVYSMLERKLNRIFDTRNLYRKAAEVAVASDDIVDPYQSIAAKIVNCSTTEDLLVFFLIAFNSIRIFFFS